MGTAFAWAQVAVGFLSIMSGAWISSGWKRPSWSPRYRRYMGGGSILIGAGVFVQGLDQLLDREFAWTGWLPALLFLAGGVSVLYRSLRDSWAEL